MKIRKGGEHLSYGFFTVVWTKLCIPRPLEVKDKGISGLGVAEDTDACTASERQRFEPTVSVTVTVMSLVRAVYTRFPSTRKGSDVGGTHSLVPAAVPAVLSL